MLKMLELKNYETVHLRIDVKMELLQKMFRRLYAHLAFNFKNLGIWPMAPSYMNSQFNNFIIPAFLTYYCNTKNVRLVLASLYILDSLKMAPWCLKK
jgi:hypothetical protein